MTSIPQHPTAEQLLCYAEADLSPKETFRWATHIDACPDCQAYMAALAMQESALGADTVVVVPFDFAASVLTRVQDEPLPQFTRRTWVWERETIAPLVLALVGMVVLVMQLRGISLTIEGLSSPMLYGLVAMVLVGALPAWIAMRDTATE